MPGRISCPILVGRQDELARISAFLAADSAGPPSLLLVAGEAGIGKSRLLNAGLSNARSAGWAVLAGSCVPVAGRTLPYGPIVEAVRRCHGAIDEPIAESLRSPLDALALGSNSDDGSSGGGARASVRARLFEAMLVALEGGAVDQPIVLAVEDLHWSDAATRDLLAFLIPNLASAGIAVMTTLRTDESDADRLVRPLLYELDRLGRLQRIDLHPLEPAGVSRMMAGILGREPSPELATTVKRRAGGNPLFVEELVAAGGAEGRLPPSLSEMLLARLASLPDETQDILRLMAVIGERLSEPLLMAVSGMPPAELRRHLRIALEAHVIRRDPEDGSLAFRHALVREALYADLLTGERRELHERVAQALEHDVAERLLSGPGRQIAVALHWDAAGRADRSLPALIAAAEAAAVAHAYGDALDLYRRCGELWDAEPPEVRDLTGTDRVTLDERIAQVASLAGDHEAAAGSMRRAIAASDPEREPARVGVFHQRLSEYLWQYGAETEALEIAARSAELVPASGAAFERVRALCSWASALEVVSRYSEAVAPAEEAAVLAAGLGDPSSRSLALAVRGTARANWDDLAGGVADLEAALSAALESSDPDEQAFPFVNGAWVIGAIARDHDRGLQIVAAWEALQRRQGLERTRGIWMAAVAGELHWMRGDWAAADAVLTAGLARPSHGPARLELLINAATFRTWQGRLDEAEDLLAELDGLVAYFVGQQFVGRAGAARVEHAAWRGDPEAALRHLAEARSRLLEPDDPLWTRQLYAVGVRACADRAERLQRGDRAGQLARLREVAEELIGLARYEGLGNLTARQRETLTWAAQGRAELLRLVGEPSADTWGEVAAEWATIGLAFPEAYARWRQAEASLHVGARPMALDALHVSQRVAGRIGAGVLLDATAGLARRARIRLEPVGPGQPVGACADKPRGLTSRELEVLALVARGLSNRQIASALFISEKTAGIHVSNILGKLEVPSRGQAAVVALRDGLVDQDR